MSILLDFCAQMTRTIDNDEDQFIIGIGPVRAGKSNTLALCSILTDPNWRPDTHACWTAKDHIRLSNSLPRGSSILRDESPDTALSGNASTKLRREFTEHMIQGGYKNHRHFQAFPYESRLSAVDKERATGGIEMVAKGVARLVSWKSKDGRLMLDRCRPTSKPFVVPSLADTMPDVWRELQELKRMHVEGVGLGDDGSLFRLERARMAVKIQHVRRVA